METVELPEGLPEVKCGLYGPVVGDDAITADEATYKVREGRSWSSRMVNRSARVTRQLSVIGGPYLTHPCVLYTAFGGPIAPKEPQDPTLDPEKRQKSEEFWSQHALSF